ncbi:MAG: sigma 54-interacting transcriptional regulator [Planctomycetota bacterium]
MTLLLQTLSAQPDLLRLCEGCSDVQWTHSRSASDLLDLPFDRKPDTLFIDLRGCNHSDLEHELAAILHQMKGCRLIAVTQGGFPLEVAASLLTVVDDEWDLDSQANFQPAWLTAAPPGSRPEPYRIDTPTGDVLTYSEQMRDLLTTARQVADSNVPIMLSGETGTGKSTTARKIHGWSSRSSNPFMYLPCGSISRDLILAELFGHTKGAFTGATQERMGKIEAASEGSLLIDEVDLLTLDDQAKLLRVVDTGEFERLGTVETSHANCRLIFAANVDLRKLVQQQRFRSDLYYRINVIDLVLPSLRDRSRDIPLLALDCLRDLAVEQNKSGLRVSLRMLWGCARHTWDGNIRELRNRLLRCMTLARTPLLAERDMGMDSFAPATGSIRSEVSTTVVPLERCVDDASKEAIIRCLKLHNNKRAAAARTLKISRSTLYRKLEEYGLLGPDETRERRSEGKHNPGDEDESRVLI